MTETHIEPSVEPEATPVGMMVLVQCDGFRCLAYRDENGKWLSAFGGEPLDSVLRVFPF
jgi:hypothetical protein